MTSFGVNTDPPELASHRELYGGHLGDTRFFSGPGKPFGWNLWPLKLVGDNEYPMISAITWNEQNFKTLVDTATRPFSFTYRHEFEAAITAKSESIANLERIYERMHDIRNDSRNGFFCTIMPILNRYQRVYKKFDWGRLSGVLQWADTLGVDCYQYPQDALLHNMYTAPGALFGESVDLAASLGIPLRVPEFGMTLASDGDVTRMGEQMIEYIGYLTDNGVVSASYFCNPNDNYHLEVAPDRMDVLRIWKSAVRATNPTPV